ncbi:MAG: valine--tRNA ligase [Myxococcota bacterium]|jgi:valyl-tRNA synthetase|nr:valine--tRNA ligase [Myxococcota bacterium]
MAEKLAKDYRAREVESRWYSFWMEQGFFHADEQSGREPFCIVIPPPNVTGKLHMGHAIFVTIQDILTRYKRMQGFEALWLPGTDHAGIATQVMVERQLAKEGSNRLELGRKRFLERVWQWKEEKGGTIIEQMKVLGASCDWERERFTMDAGLSTAVREAFVRLFEEGLIYREERLVNWDPVTQTVLSDLEVEQDSEQGSLWHIAYPVEGSEQQIVVATTRPETMLGDAAVAVHPDDPRYQGLIGKRCALPLTKRSIPIIADPLVADPQFGSGAVKITPAHDFNDYACGLRNNLEKIQVIGLDAKMTEAAGEAYCGLSREECREKVVEDLKAAGLLLRIEPYTFMPARSQRSRALVEPMLLPQWWVKMDVLAKPAVEAVESGRTTMIPKMWEKTYFNWMNNIRDWCISRQLWWGHQIPAWYCLDCDKDAIIVSKLEGAVDPEMRIASGAHPLVSREQPAKCPRCGGQNLAQDPDVLDTWFSSGLWPFSTMGWPEQTATLQKFYPTTVMETAADIIFFWVARMMMMGLHFMGETPFSTVYFHALIRDKDGQKMSKTYGNVVDPLHVVYGVDPEQLPEDERAACRLLFEDYPQGIEAQGADALRFTLAMYAAQGRDIRLDIKRVEGYRSFLNKLWQASRFVMMHLEEGSHEAEVGAQLDVDASQLSLADAWILERLRLVVEHVSTALNDFRFNEAAQAVYDFLWNEYCDWYIELSKPVLYAAEAQKAVTRSVLLHVLETVLRLLHPFAPFVTEEIWQALPKTAASPASIMVAPWPEPAPARFSEQAARMQRVIGIVQALRNLRGEANVPPGKAIPMLQVFSDEPQLLPLLEESRGYLRALTKVEDYACLPTSASRPKVSATTMADGLELSVPLEGLIDLDEERARLGKALAKLESQLQAMAKKLSNQGFVSRAPEEVVAAERAKLEASEAAKARLQAALERLG